MGPADEVRQNRVQNGKIKKVIVHQLCGWRERLWEVKVVGVAVFSPLMPVHVPWKAYFPICQEVLCGMQMAAAAAACMYSERLRDLEGHHLMSSL